jgi:hypothetical protein
MSSSRFVDVHRWVGQGAAPLDPATMQFRARLADEGARDCAGCVFKGQNWRVCMAAAALAVKAGSVDCDQRDDKTRRTHVYFVPLADVRQMSIEGLEGAG